MLVEMTVLRQPLSNKHFNTSIPMKKILINALSGIGDALMFTPALKFLKEQQSDAQIDVLVMFKGVEDIYKRIPYVNEVHYHNFIDSNPLKSLKFILSFRNKYDAAINVYPSNRKEYNIINFLLGAKKRAAVTYKRMNKLELGFLNNITIKEDDSIHNTEENIHLIEKLLNKKCDEISPLIFPLCDDDIRFSDDFITSNNLRNKSMIIGMHPGCSTLKNHVNRRWSPENFASLADLLIGKFDASVLIFGGPDELELKESVKTKSISEDVLVVNTKNLGQTAALIKKCNLFVTNDSSLMHVASAMQTNVAALIGPTNTNYIHPWKTNHKIISLELDCAPCFFYSPKPLTCSRDDVKFKCIKELNPEFAFSKIIEFTEDVNL